MMRMALNIPKKKTLLVASLALVGVASLSPEELASCSLALQAADEDNDEFLNHDEFLDFCDHYAHHLPEQLFLTESQVQHLLNRERPAAALEQAFAKTLQWQRDYHPSAAEIDIQAAYHNGVPHSGLQVHVLEELCQKTHSTLEDLFEGRASAMDRQAPTKKEEIGPYKGEKGAEDGVTNKEDAQASSGTAAGDTSSTSSTAATRPNIIVMQPDDLTFFEEWGPPPDNPTGPGKHGPMPVNLPNIEKLRTKGLQMLQAYTASPMCGTSRYSTITGKYPSRSASSRKKAQRQNTPIQKVDIPSTKLKDVGDEKDCSRDNLAVAFQSAGYKTGMMGKWHLSSIQDEDYSYTSAVDLVEGCGFDKVDGLYIENLKEEGEFDNFSDGSFSHNMEWITYEAIEFIKSAGEDPFFLYFNPTVPHGSNDVKTAITDFPCTFTAKGEVEEDFVIPGMTEGYDSCDDYRNTILTRADGDDDALGPIWVDDAVGAILLALEDKGVLDDTIFLFQLDHGMQTKEALYENGVRIAQFIHYPTGIPAGTTLEAPVSTIDIAPTLLDYAGITVPYSLDGVSWKNALDNSQEETSWMENRCLFFEGDRDRAVRCGCDKYLTISEQDETASATFQRGSRFEYATDLENLFDLCGGTDSYVTETNTEATNLIEEAAADKATILSDALACHLERTNVQESSDYATLCGSEFTRDGDTSDGGNEEDNSSGDNTLRVTSAFVLSNTEGLTADDVKDDILETIETAFRDTIAEDGFAAFVLEKLSVTSQSSQVGGGGGGNQSAGGQGQQGGGGQGGSGSGGGGTGGTGPGNDEGQQGGDTGGNGGPGGGGQGGGNGESGGTGPENEGQQGGGTGGNGGQGDGGQGGGNDGPGGTGPGNGEGQQGGGPGGGGQGGGNDGPGGTGPGNDEGQQGGGGGGGGGRGIDCPTTEQYEGTPSVAAQAAPLRGSVGCVDVAANALRDTDALPIIQNQDAFNIYGPLEAGFSSSTPKMACLGDNVVPGGLDTNLAEHVVAYLCPDEDIQVLDGCGGHAVPYHYHERMDCLYESDPTTGHSTRVGTAGDGNGIYGKNIDGGVEPTDLDACGGRFGVTPDSNGKEVYYYPITSAAPFSLGCYGPVDSVEECRQLYPDECGEGATIEEVTTTYGTGEYALDCPCFDEDGSNVEGQGRPDFLAPIENGRRKMRRLAPETFSAPIYRRGSPQMRRFLEEIDFDLDSVAVYDVEGTECPQSVSNTAATCLTVQVEYDVITDGSMQGRRFIRELRAATVEWIETQDWLPEDSPFTVEEAVDNNGQGQGGNGGEDDGPDGPGSPAGDQDDPFGNGCVAENDALETCIKANNCQACENQIGEDPEELGTLGVGMDGIPDVGVIVEEMNTHLDGQCDLFQNNVCVLKQCCSGCVSQLDAMYSCLGEEVQSVMAGLLANLTSTFGEGGLDIFAAPPEPVFDCDFSGDQCEEIVSNEPGSSEGSNSGRRRRKPVLVNSSFLISSPNGKTAEELKSKLDSAEVESLKRAYRKFIKNIARDLGANETTSEAEGTGQGGEGGQGKPQGQGNRPNNQGNGGNTTQSGQRLNGRPQNQEGNSGSGEGRPTGDQNGQNGDSNRPGQGGGEGGGGGGRPGGGGGGSKQATEGRDDELRRLGHSTFPGRQLVATDLTRQRKLQGRRRFNGVGFDSESAELYDFKDSPCDAITTAVSKQGDGEQNCITVFAKFRVFADDEEEDVEEVYQGFRKATQEAISDGTLKETLQQVAEETNTTVEFVVEGVSSVVDDNFDAFVEIEDDTPEEDSTAESPTGSPTSRANETDVGDSTTPVTASNSSTNNETDTSSSPGHFSFAYTFSTSMAVLFFGFMLW